VQKILRQHRIGAKDFDYRSFFRSKLNDVLAEHTLLSTPSSVFEILPSHQSRPAGPSHPWDFSYRGHTASSPQRTVLSADPRSSLLQPSHSAPNTSRPNFPMATATTASGARGDEPYWKRACAQPKTLSSSPLPVPLSLSASIPSLNLKFQTNSTSAATRPPDPAVLSVVKRLASHPEYRRLIENYKRNSLPSRVGYISNKHFLSSLRAIEFPLKKAEFNLLLKEFRAIGLPDTFHFQRMVDLAHGLP
jgi:hypothetical protein